jgi:tetratricopeptide (TPR) repeat protein
VKAGKYRKAVNAFGQAADINPESAGAWFSKSLALVHPGKDTEALRAPGKVLMLNPRDREAQSQRAIIVGKMSRASSSGKPDLQSVQSRLRV